MPARLRVVALLLFGSGFCALIYQTTWLREFRLIFGASTAASAAVLGVFMAGLGFGGIILGRRSESKARPLAFYAYLELLIALSAAVSPLLISGARHLYIASGGTEALGLTLGNGVRLVLAAIILGVPTFLMGGTLPAAARAVVTEEDTSRRAIGILYGANTIGAVIGALAGTFYLFENFGNHITLWWASGANILIALIAFQLAKSTPDFAPASQVPTAPESSGQGATKPLFVFGAAGLVGFAFFLMEIVWYRMLAPLLGGSTFCFGLILAVALLGIGLGGIAYTFFSFKKSASLQIFALTCAAEALFIALPYALGDRIAMTALFLRPLGTLGFHGHVIAWSALCMIVVFPAAFISGLQFPLLIALLGKGRESVGSQTGTAYAWNTIGALAGSLAGGFGFLPLFSALGVWKIAVVLLCALALVAALFGAGETQRWTRAVAPIGAAGLALLLLTATGPTAFWRHSQIGIGAMRPYHVSPNEMRNLMHQMRRQILWEAEGIESSVALAKPNSLAFLVNGKSDGNAKIDAGTQIMCGMIGAALHPNPERAMVIGLGTGSTAGWLAAMPNMQRVDVVELERAIVKVAEACTPVNHHALTNPKLHVNIGDGRELLLTTREKYDLIASEPSNPYRAGVAGLFTREFYQSVEKCLNRGGIFMQWVQTYDIDDRTIEIFYSTLGSVFPNIESWETQEGDLLLVASREPLRYQAEALRHRLGSEPLKSALAAAWRAQGLEEFLAHFVGNNEVAQGVQKLGSAPLNTDDRTVIEFAFARSLSTTTGFRMGNLRAAATSARCDRPQNIEGEIDWEEVKEARFSLYASPNTAIETRDALTKEEEARVNALTSYAGGDLGKALRWWRGQSQEPKTLSEIAMLADCLAAASDPAALKYLEKLEGALSSDAEAIRAQLYWNVGRKDEATRSMEKFLALVHDDPWPYQDLIRRALGLAETMATSDPSRVIGSSFYRSLSTPLATRNCETDRLHTLLAIGTYLDGGKPDQYTAAVIEAFEPHIMWDRRFLEVRKDCYVAVRHVRAEQAARDLDDFLAHEPFTADVPALTKLLKRESAEASAKRDESKPGEFALRY